MLSFARVIIFRVSKLDTRKEQPLEPWRKRAAAILHDLLLVAGGGLITIGVAQIYAPAGWIVAGTLLIAAEVIQAIGGDSS